MKTVLNFLKNSTRVIGGIIGFGSVIVSLPLSLLAAAFPQGEPFTPAWEVISSILGIGILLGAGFIIFSLGWPKRFASVAFRNATFVFLLFPLAIGCILIRASRTQFPPVGIAITLVAFTLWILLLCIKPNLLK